MLDDARERRRRRPATAMREAARGVARALEAGHLVDESVSLYNDIKLSLSGGPAERFISTTGSSLGWGIGCACGVALASGGPVTCTLGDGAFFFGLQSLWNAADLRLPIVFVVFDNGGFGSTRYFEDRFAAGGPAGYIASDFRGNRPAIGDIARTFGLSAVVLDDAAQLESAYAEAIERLDGPVVIHVPLPFS
jgi:benzoylformate decarboxylase